LKAQNASARIIYLIYITIVKKKRPGFNPAVLAIFRLRWWFGCFLTITA